MSGKRIPFAGLIFLVAIFLLFIASVALPGLAHINGATPGPYLSLALKAPLTPSPTSTPTPTPPYGILLISEVMVQPAVTEPDGEWVELLNAGGGTINLSAYRLGDEETRGQGEGMLQFPAGSSLAPGQVIIVANNAASFFIVYGFYPNFEMTASSPAVPDMRKALSWANGTVNLGNTGDEVLLLDNSDSLVDALSWGDSSWAFYPACPVPDSAWTLERYPAYRDTNTSSDWRLQPIPATGIVDLSSPTATPTRTPTNTATPTGTPSPTSSPIPIHTSSLTPSLTGTLAHTPSVTPTVTPTPISTFSPTPTETSSASITPTPTATPIGGWLLISEVMYDPFGSEPDAEWVELYNAGGSSIDLSSYKVGDEVIQGNPEGMYQCPTGATIDPGQVIIVAYRADVFTTTYGFLPDYELINTDNNVPDMSLYDA